MVDETAFSVEAAPPVLLLFCGPVHDPKAVAEFAVEEPCWLEVCAADDDETAVYAGLLLPVLPSCTPVDEESIAEFAVEEVRGSEAAVDEEVARSKGVMSPPVLLEEFLALLPAETSLVLPLAPTLLLAVELMLEVSRPVLLTSEATSEPVLLEEYTSPVMLSDTIESPVLLLETTRRTSGIELITPPMQVITHVELGRSAYPAES